MECKVVWVALFVLFASQVVCGDECIVTTQSGKAAFRLVYDSTVAELQLHLKDIGSSNPREIFLINHNLTSAAVYLGRGRTIFTEYRGNFNVTDYTSEKLSLYFFDVGTATQGSDEVCLWIAFRNTYAFPNDSTVLGFAQANITFGASTSLDDDRLSLVLDEISDGYDRVWFRFASYPSERIYGGGEQFSDFNMRGRSFPIWTREQGVGRDKSSNLTFLADTQDGGAGGDYHTTYWPQPMFYSDQLYSAVMTSSKYSVFDFGQDDFHEIEIWDDNFQFDFHIDGSWRNIVNITTGYLLGNYTRPTLPRWSYKGAILGLQGGTKVVMDLYDQAIANGVNVSGIWIQDWVGQITTSFGTRLFWNWQLNETRYPGIKEIIKEKAQEGVYFTAYINPYLNDQGPLYQEAESGGYLVQDKDGGVYVSDFGEFYCGTIDLTNPSAFAWYKNVIKTNLIDNGFRGWMADFGEYLPVHEAVFADGRSGEEVHNLWPSLWARLNREAIEEKGMMGEIFVWMRAGHTDSLKYTVSAWAGDQNVDWSMDDGLASVIPAALSLGMSGVGISHFDIGGFTSLYGVTRTQELLFRSAELAAFTPGMRTHEGNRPGDNWQIYTDNYTYEWFGRLSWVHAILADYTEDVLQEYYEDGVPVQRPMFYEFPGEEALYDDIVAKTQFMFGPDLLVAPIYEEGSSYRKVTFPKGIRWQNIWDSNEVYSESGSSETLYSRMGEPLVYFRNTTRYMDLFLRVRDEKAGMYPPPLSRATIRKATSTTTIIALLSITVNCCTRQFF